MSLLNFFKPKDVRRFGAVTAGRHAVDDGLKWDVRQWKFRRTEHETAKEAEVDSAWHLQ